jgi:hypothetical protein
MFRIPARARSSLLTVPHHSLLSRKPIRNFGLPSLASRPDPVGYHQFSISKAWFCISMFRIPAQARSSQLAVLCAAFFLENLFAISDYLISLAGQIQSAASSIFLTPHTKLTEQYSFSKAYSWTRYCASYTCKPDPVYWQFSVEAIELGGGLVDFLVASCCFEELLKRNIGAFSSASSFSRFCSCSRVLVSSIFQLEILLMLLFFFKILEDLWLDCDVGCVTIFFFSLLYTILFFADPYPWVVAMERLKGWLSRV